MNKVHLVAAEDKALRACSVSYLRSMVRMLYRVIDLKGCSKLALIGLILEAKFSAELLQEYYS